MFGGEFTAIHRFKDMPDADKLPPGYGEKIMHVRLPIGPGVDLMGSDVMPMPGREFIVGNTIQLSLNAANKAEADRLFNGLSAGGTIGMPMQDTFWNAYFGMFTDRFGIVWMVNFDYGTKP